jgi:uncharacterized protein YegL
MTMRRLPVYLLLDCSESMAGPAIEAVQRGVQTLVNELRGNPQALETAYLSVITFARKTKQVVPLTELIQFQMPNLSVRTGTSLGAALQLLLDCLKRDIVKTTPTTKGDYKPLVFLLTDGQPTDDWEPAADAVRAANNPRIANIYAIGCGPDVDTDVLRRVTDIVLTMQNVNPESFRKFFVWLSASVQSASTRLNAPGAEAGIEMPPLPKEVAVAPPKSSFREDPRPRQMFLHATCSKTKRPYLMRFALRPYDGRYEAIASHPLEELEKGDADLLPPIQASMLDGCPACPHCGNPIASVCGPCGAIFCASPERGKGPVTCPCCKNELVAGESGDFDIQRSVG